MLPSAEEGGQVSVPLLLESHPLTQPFYCYCCELPQLTLFYAVPFFPKRSVTNQPSHSKYGVAVIKVRRARTQSVKN